MDLTTVNLDAFLKDPTSKEGLEEAQKAAESLILTGALIVKDSRAPKESNDRFIDLFEDYFAQDKEVLEKDERPEWGYQVVCPFDAAMADDRELPSRIRKSPNVEKTMNA
jgi:hypothetical protein